MATEQGNTDFLTVPRAAKEIGVHFATIYRWIDAGKVASLKFGGILFIPITEVQRLKNTNSKEEVNEAEVTSGS